MTRTYIPAPRTDFLELARSKSGRLFKKQILQYGEFAHPNLPGEKLVFDEAMADALVTNFTNGVCDIVQVPVCDDKNQHSEDPFRNIGEVVGLTKEGDGVYATIDVRKETAAEELGKTLLGASAMLHLDYKDVRTGEKVGPTLLHTAITNRPYITNLKDFEELIAASADTDGDEPVLVLTPEDDMGDMISKEEHDAAIEALEAELDAATARAFAAEASATQGTPELVGALSRVLSDAGAIELSATEPIGIEDVAEAVVELANEKSTLATRVEVLELAAQEAAVSATHLEIGDLVRQGKILPAQKDDMVELALSNREMFDRLVPENPIVSLSEDGVTVHQEAGSEGIDAEITRLSGVAEELTGKGGR